MTQIWSVNTGPRIKNQKLANATGQDGDLMPEETRIYFIGTAGSGKSTLTQAYKLWAEERGLSAITVNLDPGVESLGYQPDVDIRDWVSVAEVMEEYGLGPNGAQIACADLAALHFHEIAEAIDGFRSNYVLIDTPGQIELFAFRNASEVFVDSFTSGHGVLAFIMDPMVAKDPSGLVSLFLLSSSIHFRFNIPMLNILGKTDSVEPEDIEQIRDWAMEPDLMMSSLYETLDSSKPLAAIEFQRAMESFPIHRDLIPISSFEMEGMEDLYNYVQMLFFGGEDQMPD
ncbi:MAG: ATP/GTP-binding protein [Thermoplasmata archaeon]|nr:ATP/GTP-binding protein [Thermoplasmata archaeon]